MVNDAKGVLGDEWKVPCWKPEIVDFCWLLCLGWGSMLIDNDPWWPFLEKWYLVTSLMWQEASIWVPRRVSSSHSVQDHLRSKASNNSHQYPHISIHILYFRSISQWEFQDPKMEVLYITVPYKPLNIWDVFFPYFSISQPSQPVHPATNLAQAEDASDAAPLAPLAEASPNEAPVLQRWRRARESDAAVGHGDPWIWNDEKCGLQYIFPSFYLSHLTVCLSICLTVWLSDCLSMYISISLYIYTYILIFIIICISVWGRSDHLLSHVGNLGSTLESSQKVASWNLILILTMGKP